MRSWSVKGIKTGANRAWETTGQGRLLVVEIALELALDR